MPQVTDDTRLYRGQGQVFLAKRVGGQPAGLEFIGNCSELMLNPQTEKIEHQESQTGNNSVDKVIERGLKVEISMTTDSVTDENLARLVFGKITKTAVTTVTLEPLRAYKDKNLILANINLTSFTSLMPAAATTPLYVLGTDYEIVDLAAGMIRILPGSTIVEGATVRANYICGASETVAAFGQTNTEYWLRFNGLNSAENDNPVIIDCFKVRFAPASDLPVINDDNFAEYKQSGTCLFDAAQPVAGKLGRFFSVRQLQAS
jgi:hypothetical protein